MVGPAKQTVAEVASQVFSGERTIRPEASGDVPFERRFRHPERNPHLGWNPDPRTIRGFQFVDVMLDGQLRGLYNHNGFIHGTGYLVPDDVMAGIGVDESRLAFIGSEMAVIVGCNVAHTNYFHWVTQALPAIDHAVNRLGQGRSIAIALPPLNMAGGISGTPGTGRHPAHHDR